MLSTGSSLIYTISFFGSDFESCFLLADALMTVTIRKSSFELSEADG